MHTVQLILAFCYVIGVVCAFFYFLCEPRQALGSHRERHPISSVVVWSLCWPLMVAGRVVCKVWGK